MRLDDVRRADALAREFSIWEGGRQFAVDAVLPRLASLVGAERACAYGVGVDAVGAMLEFLRTPEYDAGALAKDMDVVVRQSPRGWGPFDPRRVPAKLRNRPMVVDARTIDETKRRSPAFRMMFERHRAFDAPEQLRVLACEGSALLAWVGVFGERFGSREAALFRRIAPAIVNRLRTERQLGAGRVALDALDALLEEVSGAAFVVDGQGRPVHANAVGLALLEREGRACRAELADVVRGVPSARYRRQELRRRGCPPHHLVLEHTPRPDAAAAAARLGSRLNLTPRQREVLTALATGKANKTIAAELGIAEGTVELHVTALLARTQCDSRAALVAHVWTAR